MNETCFDSPEAVEFFVSQWKTISKKDRSISNKERFLLADFLSRCVDEDVLNIWINEKKDERKGIFPDKNTTRLLQTYAPFFMQLAFLEEFTEDEKTHLQTLFDDDALYNFLKAFFSSPQTLEPTLQGHASKSFETENGPLCYVLQLSFKDYFVMCGKGTYTSNKRSIVGEKTIFKISHKEEISIQTPEGNYTLYSPTSNGGEWILKPKSKSEEPASPTITAFSAKNLFCTYDKKITEGFKTNRDVVKDVSFDFKSGDLVALIGPSGCGKSTLIKSLLGIHRIVDGTLCVNDKPVTSLQPYIDSVGYMTQENLFVEELNIFDNVLYYVQLTSSSNPSKEEIKKEFDKYLLDLSLPNDITYKKIGDISGGQKQRVKLLMELIKEPDILFLDEPTSGLSAVDSLQVMHLLRRIARERQKIFITTIHQPSYELLALFTHAIVLNSNKKNIKTDTIEKVLEFFSAMHSGELNEHERKNPKLLLEQDERSSHYWTLLTHLEAIK